MFRNSVIVLGAPRSGTSLMQKIIREHDGFRSVAKESGFIWRKYSHPELQAWRYEGCPLERIDARVVEDLRDQFQRYALTAKAWRRATRFDVLRYQRSPVLAPVLRAGYFALAGISRALRAVARPVEGNEDWRLVDKSVHSALFLALVDRVFPDAKYVHIVRDGTQTVPSMIDGWMNPDRFFTYRLPGGLQIPDYPHRDWNFALPAGWEAYRSKPLADVVVFQWTRLQRSILSHFDARRANRMLRVRLEDLVSHTRPVLRRLADFIEVPWSDYFERLSQGLPSVNARPAERKEGGASAVQERMARLSAREAETLAATNSELGYPG